MQLNIKNLVSILAIFFSINGSDAKAFPTLCHLHINSFKHYREKPDFSGHWKLNAQNSSFGKIPLTTAYEVMVVRQGKDSISIMKFGDIGTMQTMALNGSTSTKSVKNKRIKKSVISWIDGKQTMVQTSTFKYEGIEKKPYQVGAIEIYKLSKDGKILTVERSVEISDPKLNWKIIAVYEQV